MMMTVEIGTALIVGNGGDKYCGDGGNDGDTSDDIDGDDDD